MDRDVIAQKLESLRRCLVRIEAKCPANHVMYGRLAYNLCVPSFDFGGPYANQS